MGVECRVEQSIAEPVRSSDHDSGAARVKSLAVDSEEAGSEAGSVMAKTKAPRSFVVLSFCFLSFWPCVIRCPPACRSCLLARETVLPTLVAIYHSAVCLLRSARQQSSR